MAVQRFPFLLKCLLPPLFIVEWFRRLVHKVFISHVGRIYAHENIVVLKPFYDKIHDYLTGIKSSVTVLEYGAGPYPNIDLLPDKSHVVICEPCPDFHPMLQKHWEDSNLKKSGGKLTLIPKKIEDITADDLEDASVDLALSKLVNCSVGDNELAFRNVHRVLKPKGRYFFWDHIRSDKWEIRFFQLILAFPGLMFFTDCNTYRRPYTFLKKAGFSDLVMDTFIAPISHPAFICYKDTASGYAVK